MQKWQRIFLRLCLIMFLFSSTVNIEAQQFSFAPSNIYHPDRLRKVVLSESVIFTLSSLGLYYLWYKKFPRSKFHFFNDNNEWLQMDKIGHMTTAYNIGLIQNDLMRWCGVRENPSIAIGAFTALTYMSIIEVMDGFSSNWGFSAGDMLANIMGTAIFAAQQKWWGQQKVAMKFSFHSSPFAKYNPAELGQNFQSRIIKDYNGQTYWLSFNIKSFLPSRSTFPEWANLALGYGAEGMTGASRNPSEINGNLIPSFKRYRQFYLSADADLVRIKSFFLFNDAAYITRFLKIPFPVLEYNTNKKWKFHYF